MLRLALRSLQWSVPTRRAAWTGTGVAAAPAAAAGVANGLGTTATAPTTGSRHRSASGGGGFGVDTQVRTDFEVRAALLKKRWRGSGQYTFARSEGQRFLDAEVPKNDLGAWMEEGNNAKALAQVLAFFEIQPEASLASLMLNKLVRVAEDESVRLTDRLYAALSLIAARPEENYERTFHVVTQALQTLSGPAMEVLSTACSNAAGGSSSSGSSGSAHSATGRSVRDMNAGSGFSPAAAVVVPPPVDEWYSAASLCAKLLQRCGRRSPPVLNEQLAAATIAVLQRTPSEYLAYIRDNLVRLYAWMVRAERPEANQVLFVLLEKVGNLPRSDFASLTTACARHHLSMQLPVELIQRLVQAGFLYRLNFSGYDAAAILGSLARMVSSLVVGVNGVTTVDVMQVQNIFGALLEEMQPRLLRLMDAQDALHWPNAGAITTCVFAYELGGHHRYRRVFQAYGAYVQHAVQTLEPAHLALATGILRRAQLLNPHLAALLSARIEVVLGELRLAELSHICATFAVLPPPRPTWWDEARAVALRLLQPDTSGAVSINLAIAFPEQPGFAETVDYAQITNRQLVDVLPITLDSAQFGDAVVSTLCQRLATPAERFAPDDLQALLACAGRPQLVQAAQAYLRDAFAQPVWSSDTLFSLPLAMDHANPENNLRHFSAAKALAAAQAASVGPEQFVALAELLLAAFGESDGPIREFVQVGGTDLVRKSDVMVSTQAHYLAVLRRYATLTPPPDWLHAFAESLQEHTFRVPLSVVEDVLLSLRTLYEDVAKTPTLQIVLSAVLRRVFGELMPPPNAAAAASEERARITVLLVYLQNGMTLPLLNASHELVQDVMQSEAQYGPEVRRAIAMMPTPKAAPAEERRGRFVLKHLNAHSSRGDAAMPVLDLNSTDPFADPLPSSELAAPPPQAPPAQPRPAAAAEASTTEPAASPPAPAPLPPSEPAAVAAEAPSKAEDVAPPPPREEKPMSYYAKFFSSSVGQILVGRGVHEERKEDAVEEATTSAPGEATALPDGGAERQPLQPRRTRLHPSTHAAAAAAHPTDAADSPAPPQQQQQHQQQQQQQPAASAPVAVPVTSFTTAWGNGGANGAGAGWGFLSAASPATPVSATQQQQLQHSTAFSSLFGMPPIHTPNAAPPPSAQATLAAASAAPPAVASPARPPPPRMGAGAGMSGNNVFYNPSDPSSSSASASASLRGRPVMSRKAVITRQGVHGAAAATATEQEDIRRIYTDTAGATQVPQTPNAAGGPQIVLDAATAAPAAAPPGGMGAGRTPATAATAYRPHQQQQQQGGGAASGMASFMHKAGVTKISGYNMDEGATDAASDGVAGAAAVSSVPGQGGTRPALDWVDAARRVGRVTRLPRSKTKTRSQHNLSAWLNTPSARLDSGVRAHNAAAAEGEGEEEADRDSAPAAAAPSHASAVAGRGRQTTVAEVIKGHRSKRKASKAADASAAAAASEAASEAGGSKRGGGAGAAGRGSRSRAAGGAAKASGKSSGKGNGGGAHHGKGGAAAAAAAAAAGAAAGAGGSAASRKKGAGKSGSGSGGGGGHAHASAGKKGAAAGAKGGKAAAAGGAGGSASRGKRGGGAAAAAVKPAKKVVKAAAKKATAASAAPKKKPAKGKKK